MDRSLEARRASRDGAAVSPEGGAGCVAGAQAPLRLTRRGRLVVVLLAVLVVAGGLLGGRAVAEGPVRAAEVQTYAVQSGDTLWAIAATVAEPGEDVRDVVLALQELNGLGDGAIAAGQVLVLPAAD